LIRDLLSLLLVSTTVKRRRALGIGRAHRRESGPTLLARARLRPFLLVGVIAWVGLSAVAAAGEIESRRRLERTTFTDAEILDGFFKISFGAEFRVGGSVVDRVRKYDGPVRVFVDNRALLDRSAQLTDIVNEVGRRIKYLDIAVTGERSQANMVVTLVQDRDLGRTIQALYGRADGPRIVRSLEPQCLSGYSKDESYRIRHAEVIIVVDAGEFVFYDCAYEEILQALGPINDDPSVPWTMFNDQVRMGFFDVYDQILLNVLYDPRIRPGMSRQEAGALVPAILPDVRSFVTGINGLKPAPGDR
jgi:Protein of unknown function (DUF2927)